MTDEARKYRLLEVVGSGTFGTVWRAEYLGTGGFTKQVALKVLNPGLNLPEEVALRLRDEARILGLISHKAVVAVDSLAVFENTCAVVMEYVVGVDLDLVLKAGPMPPHAALEIVEEVASALHTAWATITETMQQPLHLVHRDIKPSNIRLTPLGEVKILDFGVARADFLNREAKTQSLLLGSLKYMAPERLDGIDGPEGDIYSLGLVLAQLISGSVYANPPKNSKRHEDFSKAILDDVTGALQASSLSSTQVRRVAGLVMDMVNYDHEKRPSAQDTVLRARALSRTLPGTWLQEWAETEVQKLCDSVSAAKEAIDHSKCVIVEEVPGGLGMRFDGTARPKASPIPPNPARVGAAWPSSDEALPDEAIEWVQSSVIRRSGEDRLRQRKLWLALGLACLVLLGVGFSSILMGPREVVEARPVAEQAPPEVPPTATVEPFASAPPEEADLLIATQPKEAETAPPAVAQVKDEPGVTPAPAIARASTQKTTKNSINSIESEPVSHNEASAPKGPALASYSFEGASELSLVTVSGWRYPPGSLPAGNYRIMTSFDGASAVEAGTVTLSPGEHAILKCAVAMAQCRKKK